MVSYNASATDLTIKVLQLTPVSASQPVFTVQIEVDNTSTFGGGPLDSPDTRVLYTAAWAKYVSLGGDNGAVESVLQQGSQDTDFLLGKVLKKTRETFSIVLDSGSICDSSDPRVPLPLEVRGGGYDPNPSNNGLLHPVLCEEYKGPRASPLSALSILFD